MMMITAACQPRPSPTIAAGMSAISGPIYGINSMIPPMSASVNACSVSMSNIQSISVSHTYVAVNILAESISVALIQAVVTC